jgi:hypothetical protein
MMNTRFRRPARAVLWLAAALAAACSSDRSSQTIEGQVARSNFESEVLGVRAVHGSQAIAWSTVDEAGRFQIEVPVGEDYRLEVVTAGGVHGFVVRDRGEARNLTFDVCGATEAFDVGHVHGWGQSGEGGEHPGGGGCDDPCMDPDGNCEPPCGPDDPGCEPPCDPNDPDGMCPPPPCEDPTDPNCCPDGMCTPPCDPDTGEGCCGPDGSCPPPPCDDPTDPNCCPDGMCPPPPCDQPDGSGCCEGGYDDPMCWPEPGPPPCEDGPMNDECWADGVVPENPLPDFGCEG